MCWVITKAREFQKNIYFYFIDYAKVFVWITINCGKFLKRWKHQTTSPASWKTYIHVKKQQLEPNMEQSSGKTGKGVWQGCILPPCLFNFYAEYIMRNAGLEEAQVGVKIARRNINNLRYADNTILMAESEQKVGASWWEWKRRVKNAGLKLNIQKTKIMASGAITSWQIDEKTMETVTDFILRGSKITADGDCSLEIKRRLLLWINLWPT